MRSAATSLNRDCPSWQEAHWGVPGAAAPVGTMAEAGGFKHLARLQGAGFLTRGTPKSTLF